MAIVTAACISFGPPQARAASTVADTKTAVACSHLTYPMATAWYFPAAAPLALVWMQHGFVEDKHVWSALARELATRGYLVMATTLPTFNIFGCTVENLGNNTAFLDNIANVFGKRVIRTAPWPHPSTRPRQRGLAPVAIAREAGVRRPFGRGESWR